MSKGTLDTGGRKVIKKEENQAIALAVARNAKHRVAGAVEILFLKPPGVPVETRWRIGAVHQIRIFGYQLFDHWSDIISFRVFNLPI
jgi:hypothetical protein